MQAKTTTYMCDCKSPELGRVAAWLQQHVNIGVKALANPPVLTVLLELGGPFTVRRGLLPLHKKYKSSNYMYCANVEVCVF